MRYNQLIEGRDAPLFHGVNHTYAIEQLQNNRIEGRTTQRFWPDGRRLRDNHPEYDSSFWLKGVSLTRSKRYAQKWADIVYVINQARLSQHYKIIPFNWGYANAQTRGQNHKREREEFVVLGRIFKNIKDFTYEHNKRRDQLWDSFERATSGGDKQSADRIMAEIKSMPTATEAFQGPTTSSIEPLDQYITGIYAEKIHKTLNAKNIEIITNHPKFLGYF